ncbi:PREDICTED: ninja-family protein AFP3-like [Nicotiana attenuata]|uniref:Ninja-family protein n=1 Tax=Nicotiana attenuata TaxID=49451 RepID=A0A1J6JSY7_NICAT|nr:PREDICTED: ninja-family protein AFP3-like [Nicotiana attenuata]OIT20302.1 ninja-family protein afp2 [Nicotiana attenuata]
MEVLNMHVHVEIVKFKRFSVVLLIIYLVDNLWFAMGDNTDEKKKSCRVLEMEKFSMESSKFSRDLLQRFMGSSSSRAKEEDEENDEGELELNLGLSLGGRFGVDKSCNNKLIRSSSVAACLPIVRDDDALAPSPPVSYPASLVRTSSLPVETEEEWRKRKELQTLRRMEAKRRRSEKQRNLRSGDKESGGGSVEDVKREIEVNLRGKLEKEQYLATAKKFGLSVSPTLAAVARQGNLGGGGMDLAMEKGKGSYSGSKKQGQGQLGSQGSVESQGGGGSSSSMSELESKPPQGSGELSPASIHSLQGGGSQDVGSSGSKMREIVNRLSGGDMDSSPSKRLDAAKRQAKETGANALGDMPCVFTKGDGPNGRRVDGILYKYGKGEEVRIMCVCHGSFHSPAEFVKHAGGTDVAHPLKHIVVNPSASPLL